jgi:large subunit ribosomal protein L30
MPLLRITLKRSYIGCDQRQRRVIRSLGLRRLNQTKVHRDTPAIRGMVEKVRHLLQLEVVQEEEGVKANDGA